MVGFRASKLQLRLTLIFARSHCIMSRQLLASVFANGLKATVVRSPYSGRMYKETLQGPTRRLATIRLRQTPLGVQVFQTIRVWRMFNRNRLPSPKLRLHAWK